MLQYCSAVYEEAQLGFTVQVCDGFNLELLCCSGQK